MAYLAPAGTVMGLFEIGRGIMRGLPGGHAGRDLDDEIRRRAGLPHSWPVSSGRAAMTLILRALRTLTNDTHRDEVLIPAYTCYSVPASIARAGLRPRLCDVDPHTLGMDPQALENSDFSRVLAVVTANLYGMPNDLVAIERIARERGVFMLDDGAQSLGARIAGRAVGAFGDAGLYSFDKGKVICTIQGGAIVCRDEAVRQAIGGVMGDIRPSAFGETLGNCLKLPVYALCLQPTLYGAIRSLPFLGLGKTQYETEYPIAQLSDPQAGVAVELSRRLDQIAEQRRRKALRLRSALENIAGIELPVVAAEAQPAWVRFPLSVRDPGERDALVTACDRAGIGATISYPRALCDVPEVAATLRSVNAPMPGARQIASRIVTLPTHGHCPDGYEERIRAIAATGSPGGARGLTSATP